MEDGLELSSNRRPLDPCIAWGKQVAGEVFEHLCAAPQGVLFGRVTDYLGPDLPARDDWLHQDMTSEQRTAALPYVGYTVMPRVKPECTVAPILFPLVHNTRDELTALLHGWADCDFQCPFLGCTGKAQSKQEEYRAALLLMDLLGLWTAVTFLTKCCMDIIKP